MEAPSKEAAASLTSQCNAAGLCVHGSDGRNTRALKSNLLNVLTLVRFPASGKPSRKLLVNSGVTVCAVGCNQPPGLLVHGTAGPQPPPVAQCNQWLYLGLQELRPQIFEAQRLALRTLTDQLGIEDPCEEITLVGQWKFGSAWTFVRDLRNTSSWYLLFFFYHRRSGPLTKWNQSNVS